MAVSYPRAIVAALAAAGAGLAPTAASAGVVVAASGPSATSFPIGKKIGDGESIVLRTGDTLTVLDDRGTRVLRGAGSFSLGQQTGPSQRGLFAVLTERRSARWMHIGGVRAIRSVEEEDRNLWYVDVARPGNVCIYSDEEVALSRASADGNATYIISNDAGRNWEVTFFNSETLAWWDTSALPVTEGTVYRISGPEGTQLGDFRFTVLDAAAQDPEGLAEKLIEHGCWQQLELLSTATLIAER